MPSTAAPSTIAMPTSAAITEATRLTVAATARHAVLFLLGVVELMVAAIGRPRPGRIRERGPGPLADTLVAEKRVAIPPAEGPASVGVACRAAVVASTAAVVGMVAAVADTNRLACYQNASKI
jgi:hypothetical protein